MIYLLDVNVLLAIGYRKHKFYARAMRWLAEMKATGGPLGLATCSITELGFVRIASGAASLARDVFSAQINLNGLKQRWPFEFFDDGLDASQLPTWVTQSKQVTDGHLLQLALRHEATFATLDEGIPGALLIPENTEHPPGVRERYVPYGAAA